MTEVQIDNVNNKFTEEKLECSIESDQQTIEQLPNGDSDLHFVNRSIAINSEYCANRGEIVEIIPVKGHQDIERSDSGVQDSGVDLDQSSDGEMSDEALSPQSCDDVTNIFNGHSNDTTDEISFPVANELLVDVSNAETTCVDVSDEKSIVVGAEDSAVSPKETSTPTDVELPKTAEVSVSLDSLPQEIDIEHNESSNDVKDNKIKSPVKDNESPKDIPNLDDSAFSDDTTTFTTSDGRRFERLKDDSFVQEAGLQRTAQSPRKSSVERMLEETLNTSATTSPTQSSSTPPLSPTRKTSTREFYEKKLQDLKKNRSQSFDVDNLGPVQRDRKSSLYDKKNIERPTALRGNRISQRTNSLFENYEKDMTSHVSIRVGSTSSPPSNNIVTRSLSTSSSDDGEKTRAELAREEKERELDEIKQQYHQRLEQEAREEDEKRKQEQQELKCRKSLGAVKNAYLKVATGEQYKHSDSEDDLDAEGEKIALDKHGVPCVKSGQKESVVKSADGVGNIRERFNSIGKQGWKKRTASQDNDMVTGDIRSARSVFNKSNDRSSPATTSYVRPVQKKVTDPRTLMEQRKKLTYANEEEIPQDGVIKKSVVIEETEVGKKADALNVYKRLETSSQNDTRNATQKPRAKILSEHETHERMDAFKTKYQEVNGAQESVEGTTVTAEVPRTDYV